MTNTLRYISARHILALLLSLPVPASAACTLCTCMASATGVSFGRYSPLSGFNADYTGNVRISCGGAAGTVAYTIQLNRGMYSGGFNPRRMGSGGNGLNYQLYADPAHTIIWGDGSSGTGVISDSVSVSVGGSSRNHIVYGRIPARQRWATVGSYSDTITVTVIYQ